MRGDRQISQSQSVDGCQKICSNMWAEGYLFPAGYSHQSNAPVTRDLINQTPKKQKIKRPIKLYRCSCYMYCTYFPRKINLEETITKQKLAVCDANKKWGVHVTYYFDMHCSLLNYNCE